jgi:uncharacterized peroxidase-related enzyme
MFLQDPPTDPVAQALYDEASAEDGYVANFLKVWCWRPEVHRAFCDLRRTLAAQTTLTEREIALLNATTASRLGDAYCSLAWGSRLAKLSSPVTAAALLARREPAELDERERALVAWASAVVADPNGTTPEHIERLKRAGLDDRAIFDATVLVAFRLAFSTVNDALGATPDQQLAGAAPQDVLASITYGRAVGESARI